jgi:GNAT superfamily N-acetyltransferase
MILYDKFHNPHDVEFADHVTIDGAEVTRMERTHNTVLMHGFHVPPHLQSRGIGSALLHVLERKFTAQHATQLRIVIPLEHCPQYQAFFEKHKYSREHNVWIKNLVH